MSEDAILFLIVGLGIGFFLWNRSQSPVSVLPAGISLSRSDIKYNPPNFNICPAGQYLGSDFSGQPACLPIGAMS